MKRILLLVVVAIMATVSAQAQFPDDVKEVLKKCDQKMETYGTSEGVVFDMNVKMKALILTLNGTLKSYVKNKKFFHLMDLNLMGKGIKYEMGFDGEQKWKYTSGISEKKKDTLEIAKTKDAKNDYSVKTDYDKEYKKAKMKEVGRYYEITFSSPLKKDVPKKASIKIDKESYLLREFSVDEDMGGFTGKVTLTIMKITKGCSDNWFKLDMNRYKNAVVVRR